MKKWRLNGLWISALLIIVGSFDPANAAPIDELIAGAKKEGVIELYAPSTLTPQGAQRLGEAFNKQYGLNLKLNFNPSGSMTRDVGKIVGISASGLPQEWDVMLVHDGGHATLWLKKLHKPFDYTKVGVDPQAVQYDNGTVILANQFVMPAYNKQLVASQELAGPSRPQVERRQTGYEHGDAPSGPAGNPVGREQNNRVRETFSAAGTYVGRIRHALHASAARGDFGHDHDDG